MIGTTLCKIDETGTEKKALYINMPPSPPKTMLEKVGRTAECCSGHLITKKLNIVLGGKGGIDQFCVKSEEE